MMLPILTVLGRMRNTVFSQLDSANSKVALLRLMCSQAPPRRQVVLSVAAFLFIEVMRRFRARNRRGITPRMNIRQTTEKPLDLIGKLK
ncbi:hypothetical protein TgHK011_010088 [Trichoderma gracile]|nr:hypothetical protein TgHK011_010088 [Trichoderma gracile]